MQISQTLRIYSVQFDSWKVEITQIQRTHTHDSARSHYQPATNHPTKMTRSHKANDRDHKGLADGTAQPSEHLPRFFAKSGHADVDPKKIKKDGSGRGNWGCFGDDVVDENFRFTNARRRSNSSSFSHMTEFKTKFEVNEPEPVFEESVHGPNEEEEDIDLSKTDSSESGRSST